MSARRGRRSRGSPGRNEAQLNLILRAYLNRIVEHFLLGPGAPRRDAGIVPQRDRHVRQVERGGESLSRPAGDLVRTRRCVLPLGTPRRHRGRADPRGDRLPPGLSAGLGGGGRCGAGRSAGRGAGPASRRAGAAAWRYCRMPPAGAPCPGRGFGERPRADAALARRADSASYANYAKLCAALLDAARASGLGSPDAHDRLVEADSLARDFIFEICCGGRCPRRTCSWRGSLAS
jgi:hypothetical protein